MHAANIKEENIVWSDKDFKLGDFVEIYQPPQIVKVEEGYMDNEEDRTLSASQVLTLHVIKDIKTVRGFDKHNLKISLPTNSTAKVEILCQPSIYENVTEVATDLPSYVASVEKHPWLKVDVNDVLEIKSTSKSFRSTVLVCLNVTKSQTVEFPLDYKARFKSLGGCPSLNPTMADVATYCKFPVTVKYIDDELKVIHDGYNANYPIGMNMLGPLKLQSIAVNKILLTKAWGDDKVIPLPLNLEVRVVAALGALQNDHNYSRLCKIAHNSTNIDELDLKFIKEGEYKVLLEKNKSQVIEDDVDERETYCAIAPRVPSRDLKPNRRNQTTQSDSSSEMNKQSRGNKGRLRGGLSRSTSVHLPAGEMVDDVFGESVRSLDDTECSKSRFSPMKKVFQGIKTKTKHEYKVLKKAVNAKTKKRDSVSEEYEDMTPDPSHGASSHAIPSHETSKYAITRRQQSTADPGYGEVISLPPNIPADRVNDGFIRKSLGKGAVDRCKIKNPNNMRTWTIEEVSECLRYCRLEEYIDVFKQEMIDGCLLVDLDEESLRSLGMSDKLHITKTLKIIHEGWLPKKY